MKAAITDGKGKLWVEDVPMPEPGPYQALCRIEACASCTGTDQKHIQGKLPFPCDYPGVLGHESVGTVLEVGARVKRYRVGDRVFRPAAVLPGGKLGEFFSAWGGFAEFGLVQDTPAMIADGKESEVNPYGQFQQVIPGDLSISSTDATTLITLKEAASLVNNAGAHLGVSVVILGAGSVGISMCRCAKLMGAAPVIVVARRQGPLDHAKTIGADATVNCETEDMVEAIRRVTSGRGADRIIDTTGVVEMLTASKPVLSKDGKLVPYAVYETMDTVNESAAADRVLAVGPDEVLAHDYMISAVRLNMLDPAAFYSHRLPLEDIVRGFELIRSKEAFKIVCEMKHG